MPSQRKKKVLQATRKRQQRGRIYLVAIIIIITTIGIGWYVYASSQSPATPSNTLPDIVYAKLNTSQGIIEIELYHSLTPKTVENFVNLAQSGFYNNLVWWRIYAGFAIQTGDPLTRNAGGNRTTWGTGTSQSIPFEYDASLHNAVGYVAMASTAQKVGGSCQFYINLADNSSTLDGNYAVFGKVISGMNAVNALAALPTTTQYTGLQAPQPVNPANAMLISVTISNSP
jgi:cyclophilin family peptidyl-prolyl cis-trans isomerase